MWNRSSPKNEPVIRFISEKKSSENFEIFAESILDRVEASKAYYNLGVSYAEMHKYDKVPWWQFLFGATGGKSFFNKNAKKRSHCHFKILGGDNEELHETR